MRSLTIFMVLILFVLAGCTTEDTTLAETTYKQSISESDNVELEIGSPSYAIDGSKESLIENSEAYVSATVLSVGDSFYDGSYIETLYSVEINDSNTDLFTQGDIVNVAIMGGVITQEAYLEDADPDSKIATDLSNKSEEELAQATISQTGEGSTLLEVGSTYEMPLNSNGDYYQVLLNADGITKI